MDKDLAEIAMNKALDLGAEYAEARMEQVTGEESLLKNGNPEVSGFTRDAGISMRVLFDGALGFSSTNRLDKPSVLQACEECVRMAKAASRIVKHKISYSSEDPQVKDYAVPQKKKITDVSGEDLLGAMFDIYKGLPESVNLVASFFNLAVEGREKYFVNSEGSRIKSNIPRVHIFMLATIAEDGAIAQAMLQLGAAMGWEFMDVDKLTEHIGHEISMTQNNLKHGKSPPKGSLDMILGPEVTGIATHESCGHPYEADRILGREAAQAGESFMEVDMIGQRIGSETVSVIDDPTIEHSYGFYLFDDEGVPGRPKKLMQNGIINDFFHNRETGSKMGVKSNGSSRACNYDREAIVRMSNTFVEPGDYVFDELVEDVKLGILMNSFMEWNIDDKRYNQRYVGREAYLIENGETGAPIKAPTLEITTPGFWSSIDAVGKDLEFFAATCGKGDPGQGIPVFVGGPHIRLRNIKLGGG